MSGRKRRSSSSTNVAKLVKIDNYDSECGSIGSSSSSESSFALSVGSSGRRRSIDDYNIPPPVVGLKMKPYEKVDLAKEAEEGRYLIQLVLDSKVDKAHGRDDLLFRVKWDGYELNCEGSEQWLTTDQFGDSEALDNYLIRENCILNVKPQLCEPMLGKAVEFADKYPNFYRRKDFESFDQPATDYQRYLLYLREEEAEINRKLAQSGQPPIYIENWTEDLAILDFKYIPETEMCLDVFSRVNSTACDLADKNAVHVCVCKCRKCGPNCACAIDLPGSVSVNPDGSLCADELQRGATFMACGLQCRCEADCPRRAHESGRKVPVMLFYFGELKGWGLVAVTSTPAGTCIGKYAGQLLDKIEMSKMTERQRGSPFIFDVVGYDDTVNPYAVDATEFGNETRFLNHACEPNVVPVNLYTGQNITINEIAFYTKKTVNIGEEFTFCYSESQGKRGGRCLCRPGCKRRL